MNSDQIQDFIDAFSKLPSIGPRQATRLAFYLINSGQERIEELSGAVNNLKSAKLCAQCFFAHQNSGALCNICENAERQKDVIAVMEKSTDLISMEQSRAFNGRYFLLGEF